MILRRKPSSPASEVLPDRMAALVRAADAAEGRLPDDLVAQCRAVLGKASERLGLSAGHTVVALAGSTGSGKSSLFNALTGSRAARVGVLRPTTAETLAGIWPSPGTEATQDGGPGGSAGALLDWLGVSRRVWVDAAGMEALDGLILLDLPDHDSAQAAHKVEVDRLAELVDVFVWVVDPEKYADAALHEGYLRPRAGHEAVTVVVLNQVDRLGPEARAACVGDLRRVLDGEGLSRVEVVPVSARTGEGLHVLRGSVERVVASKAAAAERLLGDVAAVAWNVSARCAEAEPAGVGREERTRLDDALAGAAGVDVVANAVARSHRIRARQATGWPPTRWLSRFRPDPLRRLHLDRLYAERRGGGPGVEPAGGAGMGAMLGRTSVPAPSPVQRARVDSAVRHLADRASAGLPPDWVEAVRRAAREATGSGTRSGGSALGDGLGRAVPARSERSPGTRSPGTRAPVSVLADDLDQAVAGVRLRAGETPRWWRLAALLQWLAFGVLIAGAMWLAALALFGYLRLPEPPIPDWRGFPVPTLLLIVGVLAGVLTALGSRVLAGRGAARRGRAARAALRGAVSRVGRERVIAPIEAELAAHATCRDAAREAAGK